MGKVSSIREAKKDEPRKLTQKEIDQLAFKTGDRKTRRRIAKKYGFFKDKSGTAWREANKMIRDENAGTNI